MEDFPGFHVRFRVPRVVVLQSGRERTLTAFVYLLMITRHMFPQLDVSAELLVALIASLLCVLAGHVPPELVWEAELHTAYLALVG